MGSYAEEVQTLAQHCELIELQSGTARVAVSPSLQGKVLTSCTDPMKKGFGWLNHALIQSGKVQPHIQAYGGEDRLWLGPEAGQYGIFFKPGVPFTFSNWQTPAPIDTQAFDLTHHTTTSAVLKKVCSVRNYQNTVFEIEIEREISVLSNQQIQTQLGLQDFSGINTVGFYSENKLYNRSAEPWKTKSGLLNIWILGMFISSPKTYAIVPVTANGGLTTDYFPTDLTNRLWEKQNHVVLKVDGRKKTKIGIAPTVDKAIVGSFDRENNRLTLVTYSTPKEDLFLNTEWKIQDEPYVGDVINIYNDGPNEDGTLLGPYFELETNSSTKPLKKDEFLTHRHTTVHFEGNFEQLNAISKACLYFDLQDLSSLA